MFFRYKKKQDVDIEGCRLIVDMQIVEGKATERDKELYPDRITADGRIRKIGKPKMASGKRVVPLTEKALYYIKRLNEQFTDGEMLVQRSLNICMSGVLTSATSGCRILTTKVLPIDG